MSDELPAYDRELLLLGTKRNAVQTRLLANEGQTGCNFGSAAKLGYRQVHSVANVVSETPFSGNHCTVVDHFR
jgi:hypothetical protein